MMRSIPDQWAEDEREIAKKNRRIKSWIHESGATVTVRCVLKNGFEVVVYPEQIPEYMGIFEIYDQHQPKQKAVSSAIDVMYEERFLEY